MLFSARAIRGRACHRSWPTARPRMMEVQAQILDVLRVPAGGQRRGKRQLAGNLRRVDQAVAGRIEFQKAARPAGPQGQRLRVVADGRLAAVADFDREALFDMRLGSAELSPRPLVGALGSGTMLARNGPISVWFQRLSTESASFQSKPITPRPQCSGGVLSSEGAAAAVARAGGIFQRSTRRGCRRRRACRAATGRSSARRRPAARRARP